MPGFRVLGRERYDAARGSRAKRWRSKDGKVVVPLKRKEVVTVRFETAE